MQSSADYHFPIKRVKGLSLQILDIGFGNGRRHCTCTRARPFSERERNRIAVTLNVLAAKVCGTVAFAQLRMEVAATKMANEAARRGVAKILDSAVH